MYSRYFVYTCKKFYIYTLEFFWQRWISPLLWGEVDQVPHVPSAQASGTNRGRVSFLDQRKSTEVRWASSFQMGASTKIKSDHGYEAQIFWEELKMIDESVGTWKNLFCIQCDCRAIIIENELIDIVKWRFMQLWQDSSSPFSSS